MTDGPSPGAELRVDLDALAANHRLLTRLAGPAEVAPVVKADAYGLGVGPVARRLWREGARRFFVAQADEALALRAELGPERPASLFVLEGVTADNLPALAKAGATPVLNSPAQIALWRSHGGVHGIAGPARRPLWLPLPPARPPPHLLPLGVSLFAPLGEPVVDRARGGVERRVQLGRQRRARADAEAVLLWGENRDGGRQTGEGGTGR